MRLQAQRNVGRASAGAQEARREPTKSSLWLEVAGDQTRLIFFMLFSIFLRVSK